MLGSAPRARGLGPRELLVPRLAEVARVTVDPDSINKRAPGSTPEKGIQTLSKADVTHLTHLMDRGSSFAAALNASLRRVASIPDSVVQNLQ